MTNYLRFRDLKARGIVNNWVTLKDWIDTQGFPPGRLLGPHTRAWTDEEVEEWLAARPTGPAKKTPKRRQLAAITVEEAALNE